jgi:uncharacterized protein YjbJ (UPF0337 family)
VGLNQQTKEKVTANFDQVKQQLQSRYTDLQDEDFTEGQNDPDKLVEAISKRTGESKQSVSQQVEQISQGM